ncbi:type 2 periplasmic-binding domain-containing protein [Enterococcus sp. LJL98]
MKKVVGLLSTLVLSGIILTGCGSGGSGSGEAAEKNLEEYKPYGKYEEPIKFTIGRGQRDLAYMPEGDTIEDSPASRFLKEQTNIEAEVAWETADLNQKVALSISTGDLPDVMVVGEKLYKELRDNNLLADLTEAYDKAASDNVKERINSYGEDILKHVSQDDKLYAIPTPYYYYEQTLTWLRKDWLDELGEDLPETTDDLYQLAKKFIEKDMAGNGKTAGFTLADWVAGVFGAEFDASPIFNQHGSYPRQWIEKDGEVVYGSVQPETKEILGMLSDWYKEGVLDQQFAVRSAEEREGVLTDSVGIHFAPWWSSQFAMAETIKNNPNADWVAMAGPKEDGTFQTYTGTPVVRYVVVNKNYEHPEAIMRAINNVTDFNFSLTEEAIEYRKTAFDGDTYFPWYYAPIDYKLENAHANRNDYEALKQAKDTGNGEELPEHLKGSWELIKQYKPGEQTDVKVWSENSVFMEGLKAATDEASVYNDMAFYGTTKTMDTKWVNLKKMEDELFLKIIMGEESLDAFDEFVKVWKSSGGDEITLEVQEEVKAMN